jgi:hypothetical protein
MSEHSFKDVDYFGSVNGQSFPTKKPEPGRNIGGWVISRRNSSAGGLGD